MISYNNGDIFNEFLESDAIVNTVNCVGVMGGGLALSFKNKFLDNYKAYKVACDRNEVVIGKMFVHQIDRKYIINFPTKLHWRDPSRIEYIETGLQDLIKTINDLNIQSIAIPALGCGLGGLDWDQIKLLMDSSLSVLTDVKITIIEPK